jgi:hypothetical protein
LDFLGFIRPNRDFLMGYERKNKKKSTRVSGCVQNVSDALSSFLPGGGLWQGQGSIRGLRKIIADDSDYDKLNVGHVC